ncbi:MAG TPA: hypothetical protein PK830_01090 [Candidatus Atribacteria bacterium]|nr:hypothetical protein [Candidatus Atribacteria bacterium]HPT77693.1 hypothetical protein [Candidatus Atribacteria bacterium]
MMYSEEEQLQVHKQFKSNLITAILVLVLFLAIALAFMTRLEQWIGAVFLSVGVCISLFLLLIYTLPVWYYYRFVSDIVNGRSREIQARVIRVADKPVYKDNKLLYYEVIVIEDDVERMLLFDANKGRPEVKQGDMAIFRIHENFIVNIRARQGHNEG